MMDRHAKQDRLRARAREVDERAAHVLELMATGRWLPGSSHAELARTWGVTDSEVQHVAQRAGQALRVLMLVDREDMRARNAAHLAVIASDAHQAGEYGDAVRAIAEQGKLLGLNAPERSQVEVKADPRQQYEAMPRPERVRWLRENIAELQALLDAELDADAIATPLQEQSSCGTDEQ